MPLTSPGFNALRSAQRHRTFEGSNRNLCSAAGDLEVELSATSELSRDWAGFRDIVGDVAGNSHYRDICIHLFGNDHVDGAAVGIQIERSSAIGHASECNVAGDGLEF